MTSQRVKPYPWCFLGLCGHVAASDETGCWGQCRKCGNRAGFVSRAALRRYADAEIANAKGAEMTERCIACAAPFRAGDLVLPDASGGTIHAACCGPERESYTNADGDPLGPNDLIPQGYAWSPDPVVGAR